MPSKRGCQLLLQLGQFGADLEQSADQIADLVGVGRDQLGRVELQLGSPQPGLDLGRLGSQVALATVAAQRRLQLAQGKSAALLRAGAHCQYRQRVTQIFALSQQRQGARVEVEQAAAELVAQPLLVARCPDMAAGPDPDRLGLLAIAGQGTQVLALGPHQVGQHVGIATVGFGPGRRLPLSGTCRGQRIDRIDQVAAADQGIDQKPMTRLDSDHHLAGLLGQADDRVLESAQALHASSDAQFLQSLARPRLHLHLVVLLRPVDADEDHDYLRTPVPPVAPSRGKSGRPNTSARRQAADASGATGTTSSAVQSSPRLKAGARFSLRAHSAERSRGP